MAGENALRLRRLGIDTQQEHVVYMRNDCHICRSEGFGTHARIRVNHHNRSIVATLHHIGTNLLSLGEASLSESAWQRLGVTEGDQVSFSHIEPVDSLGHVRAKLFGHALAEPALREIMTDIVAGSYSDIHLAAFVAACSGGRLNVGEITALTRAMVDVGDRLSWTTSPIVDKHCVGGLPGNRTTPIIVAIAGACGLTMPKTSSRAITSPAGTADTMETLAPVALSLAEMRAVVEKEGACIVWGGAVNLSPADDLLVRIERALDIDSKGQLVASVLSKKVAAGSTHLVLDLPVGQTAKLRTKEEADVVGSLLRKTASSLGLRTRLIVTDGSQPVGRGIGPALEAREVLAVLDGRKTGSSELRRRSISLAGALLELGRISDPGLGEVAAAAVLDDGRAKRKFERICEAQGGMRKPPFAKYKQAVTAERPGTIDGIDNRRLARIAKLAGAPDAKAAGLELHVRFGDRVELGQPVFTIHAETPGELSYASEYAAEHPTLRVRNAE